MGKDEMILYFDFRKVCFFFIGIRNIFILYIGL